MSVVPAALVALLLAALAYDLWVELGPGAARGRPTLTHWVQNNGRPLATGFLLALWALGTLIWAGVYLQRGDIATALSIVAAVLLVCGHFCLQF